MSRCGPGPVHPAYANLHITSNHAPDPHGNTLVNLLARRPCLAKKASRAAWAQASASPSRFCGVARDRPKSTGRDVIVATRGVGTLHADAFCSSCTEVLPLMPKMAGLGALLPVTVWLLVLPSSTLRVEVGVCVLGLSSWGFPKTQSATQIEGGAMEQLGATLRRSTLQAVINKLC